MSGSPEAILGHLRDVLASRTFHQAEHAQCFLRFIVDETLAGRADRVKEYTVAVDVFGRDPSFDPRIDTIVRTEARRLRARMEQYYRTEGADAPVRIVLRKGSYVPVFETANQQRPPVDVQAPIESAITAQPPTQRSGRVWALYAMALLAVVALAIGGFAALTSEGTPEPPPNSIAVLPFTNLGAPDREFFGDGITEEIIESLGHVPNVRLVGRSSSFQFRGRKSISVRSAARSGCVMCSKGV